MAMGIAVSPEAIFRDESGRFISALDRGAEKTVIEAIERGARLSRRFAPSGHKPDPRTPKLKDSIDWAMLSSTKGVWFATARHALPIEKGASAHPIPGSPGLKFWWDKKNRMFVPSGTRVDVVQHPGNVADPYLLPAYAQISSQLVDIAKKHFPG